MVVCSALIDTAVLPVGKCSVTIHVSKNIAEPLDVQYCFYSLSKLLQKTFLYKIVLSSKPRVGKVFIA